MKECIVIISLYLCLIINAYASQVKEYDDYVREGDQNTTQILPDSDEDPGSQLTEYLLSGHGADGDEKPDHPSSSAKFVLPYLFNLIESLSASIDGTFMPPVRDSWREFLYKNYLKTSHLSEPFILLPIGTKSFELLRLIENLQKKELNVLVLRLKIKYKSELNKLKKVDPVKYLITLSKEKGDFFETLVAIINDMPNRSNEVNKLKSFLEKFTISAPEAHAFNPMPYIKTLPGDMSISDFQTLTGIELIVQSDSASAPHVHAFETMNQLISAHLLGQAPLPPAHELIISDQSLEQSDPVLFCPNLTGVRMSNTIYHLHWTADQLACQLLMENVVMPSSVRIVLEDAETGIVRVITPLLDPEKKPRLSVSYQEDQIYRLHHGLPEPDYEIVIKLPPSDSRNLPVPFVTMQHITWEESANDTGAVLATTLHIRKQLESLLTSVIENQIAGKEWVHASLTTEFRVVGVALSPELHEIQGTPIQDTSPIVGGVPIRGRILEFPADFSSQHERLTSTSKTLEGQGMMIVFAESEMSLKDSPQTQALSLARDYFSRYAALSPLFRGLFIRFMYSGSPLSRSFGYLFNHGGGGLTRQNFDSPPTHITELNHNVSVVFASPEVLQQLLSGQASPAEFLSQNLIQIQYSGPGSEFADESKVRSLIEDVLKRLEPGNRQQ